MPTNDLETCIIGIEGITNNKCHKRSEVTSEEVLASGHELPILSLQELLKPTTIETLTALIYHMEWTDG
jgi:hypothetical protein